MRPSPPKIFKLIGGLCILNCMFQGLVFLVFKSDEVCDGNNLGCSLGTGGKCGVSAVVFWFLAGISSCAAGKEKDDDTPVSEAPAAETHDEKVQDETAVEGEEDAPVDEAPAAETHDDKVQDETAVEGEDLTLDYIDL
jgi:hypothetical protein